MESCRRTFFLICVLLAMTRGALAVVNPSLVSAAPAEATWRESSPDVGLSSAAETLGKLPLAFIENQGQIDPGVKFYAKVPNSSVYFTSRDLVLSFSVRPGGEATAGAREKQRGAFLRLVPEGLSPQVRLVGQDRQEHRVNYFIGNVPDRWRTGIPTFRAVTYQEAYPGIDLQFYGTGRALEYDIIIKPGSNPSQVRFHCIGARSLEITPTGELAVKLPGGPTLVHKQPLIYQEINGVRVKAEGRFKILGDPKQCRYGFQVASYDRQRPLVIDPVLDFSTFLGGSYADYGQAIAVDRAGNIYVAGYTTSWNFPICYEGSHLWPYVADDDAFVTKIKADGSRVIYSTFLGGGGRDEAHGVAFDVSGNAYVTGFTGSSDFPTAPTEPGGPLYTYQGNGDAFVAKISADGRALVFSTYLGGKNVDFGRGIAVDGENNVYVTGYTMSSSFPTWPSGAPLRPFGGNTDAFVTKINADATALLYSTFLGGEGNDRGYAMAVDAAGNAYVTGETDSSTTFPTWPAGAPLLNYGGGTSDAFVTKIRFDGTALVFSTFLGGGNADFGYGIALDGNSNLFITGETASATFPVSPPGNPLRPYGGSIDAFVTKIMENGSAIVFSTFLGGTYIDRGHAVAVDQFGDVYVAGATESANFPTWPSGRPLFSKSGETDAFVTKIKGNGSALVFSTFLGGTYIDRAYGLAVDRQGSAYITGFTESDGGGTSTPFPQKRALQEYAGGTTDAFVAKIAFGDELPWLMLLLLD